MAACLFLIPFSEKLCAKKVPPRYPSSCCPVSLANFFFSFSYLAFFCFPYSVILRSNNRDGAVFLRSQRPGSVTWLIEGNPVVKEAIARPRLSIRAAVHTYKGGKQHLFVCERETRPNYFTSTESAQPYEKNRPWSPQIRAPKRARHVPRQRLGAYPAQIRTASAKGTLFSPIPYLPAYVGGCCCSGPDPGAAEEVRGGTDGPSRFVALGTESSSCVLSFCGPGMGDLLVVSLSPPPPSLNCFCGWCFDSSCRCCIF